MTTVEERFAAALMAKLTGNVLSRVDESTLNPPSSGPANRIDAMSFVRTTPQIQSTQAEQNIINQINAAAEMAYPLPQASITEEPSPQQEFNFSTPLPAATASIASSEVTNTLKSIDESIKRLVTLLETKWQTT